MAQHIIRNTRSTRAFCSPWMQSMCRIPSGPGLLVFACAPNLSTLVARPSFVSKFMCVNGGSTVCMYAVVCTYRDHLSGGIGLDPR